MGPHASHPDGARDRLRRDVTREVAELRCRLHEIALRGEALIEAGRMDEAARVLAEQRALLQGFERRLARRVAEAKVQGSAEATLADLAG